MADYSRISWCDSSFNIWWGCAKVSPGCAHCYAERDSNRWGYDIWGVGRGRKMQSEAYWQKPLKWNDQPWSECPQCNWRGPEKKAVTDHSALALCPLCETPLLSARRRVFIGSMCDIFELHTNNEVGMMQTQARKRLWQLIEDTPNLDHILLTKRAENIAKLNPWKTDWPENVWMGVSIENQDMAKKRLPHLLECKAQVKWLSLEPLLGPIQFDQIWPRVYGKELTYSGMMRQLDWIVVGGESGPKARPMGYSWARAIYNECRENNIPFHFKQWGEWIQLTFAQVMGITKASKKEINEKNFLYVSGEPHEPYWRCGMEMAGAVLIPGINTKEFPE